MSKLLHILIFLSGIALLLIGGGVGLGGILTLGLQIPPDFITVTKPEVFDVQDNHVRYLGGFFFMAGVVFVVGTFQLAKLRTTLIALCIMVFGAALFRFLGGNANVFGRDLVVSLVLEIIYAPLLAIWLWKSNKGEK